METLQDKQRAFLEETINHYNSTNRGVKEGSSACCYSKGCAIGRKLSPELCQEFDERNFCDQGVSNEYVFSKLPEELKELGKGFLIAIQALHDWATAWNEQGISAHGKIEVRHIKKRYKL